MIIVRPFALIRNIVGRIVVAKIHFQKFVPKIPLHLNTILVDLALFPTVYPTLWRGDHDTLHAANPPRSHRQYVFKSTIIINAIDRETYARERVCVRVRYRG